MNKLFSTQNRVFFSLVGLSETGKSKLIYDWLESRTQKSLTDFTFFINFPKLFLRCYAKRNLKSRECAWSKS